MRRSIRWMLLGWYAFILLVVIAGFGAALYLRQRAADLSQVDAELRTHALAIANAIEWDVPDGFEFEFRDEYRALFEQGGVDAPYLMIWGPDEDLLFRTRAAPAEGRPGASPPHREITTQGPAGTRIRVGRGIDGLERSHAELGWAILLGGVVALGVALLGGWLLVRHVLRPIDRISEAASRISVSNLSERIDLGRTESELGRLAGTLNKAFDRLEAAVERQAEFTADASHELRTPLAVIRASAEWALRGNRSPEDQREALEACFDAAKRMTGTVEDLLALARADARADETRRDPVDLADLATEATALLQPWARERGVSLSTDAGPAPAAGDRQRLLTATLALVSNAIRHNREGGHVVVETHVGERSARLAVSDDGPGIPAEHLPRVFQRFYRVDSDRSGRTGGSGLGLAIAKAIVEAHGGEVTLQSEVGHGCRVEMRIPATPSPGAPREA